MAAPTTAGYSGMLAGPAVIGFLSKGSGLHNAFWFLAALFVCPPLRRFHRLSLRYKDSALVGAQHGVHAIAMWSSDSRSIYFLRYATDPAILRIQRPVERQS